jgi:hypothetical protein
MDHHCQRRGSVCVVCYSRGSWWDMCGSQWGQWRQLKFVIQGGEGKIDKTTIGWQCISPNEYCPTENIFCWLGPGLFHYLNPDPSPLYDVALKCLRCKWFPHNCVYEFVSITCDVVINFMEFGMLVSSEIFMSLQWVFEIEFKRFCELRNFGFIASYLCIDDITVLSWDLT